MTQPAQIRALESPMRQDLIDAIGALGACSMADLAAYLGCPADSLYFHIRKLVRVGLVSENGRERRGRHAFATYSIAARIPRIHYTPANARSIQRVVAGAMRLSIREFALAFGDPDARFSGPQRTLWGGRIKGWLNDEEVAELNQRLDAISDLMQRSGPGEGRRVHSFAWISTPVRVKKRTARQERNRPS